MKTFIEEVVFDYWSKEKSFDQTLFLIPSKRSGVFLKKQMGLTAQKTIFSPSVMTIEEFVEKLSQLRLMDTLELTLNLFETQKEVLTTPDSFEAFMSWGPTLLQDIIEIDRYLVDAQKVFSYLSEIQNIDHWYLSNQKTQLIKEYLLFWKSLPSIQAAFEEKLLKQKAGHQGLLYKKALNNAFDYIQKAQIKKVVIMGFNAHNKAEIELFKILDSKTQCTFYWDVDPHFLNDSIHDAGFFIRKHQKSWAQKVNSINLGKGYLEKKNIEIIGVPKKVSQAKYVAQILKENKVQHSNMALVLADEALLNPILNAIPDQVSKANITMGYPLNKSPFFGLFLKLFAIYLHKNDKGYYHKNLYTFFLHPNVSKLVNELIHETHLHKRFVDSNKIYFSKKDLEEILGNNSPLLFLFEDIISPIKFVHISLELLGLFKNTGDGDNLQSEHLFRFYTLFNKLEATLMNFEESIHLKSLKSLFEQLIVQESLDFMGEPLEGLQVMGMLESRNLDFESVILTSVNEGILPSGKSNNSLIPYDVKRDFGLPTYKEKDAVYTYHFYRLLQRAKNVFILYNTEPDSLEGGEKSRLIAQMVTDPQVVSQIKQYVASPEVVISQISTQQIKKTEALTKLIEEVARKGFSPTSLSNYIRNPIDFYKRNILKLNEVEEVEETLAANTFGTIVHDSLEELYTPLLQQVLNKENLNPLKTKISESVQKNFVKTFRSEGHKTGKNLIAYHAITKYVENIIDLDIKAASEHEIILMGLEKNLEATLNFPELKYPIKLRGKLDRVDRVDGHVRIIDYKTGKVENRNVTLKNWDEITEDYSKSKAFQLMCYSLMYHLSLGNDNFKAGIISVKNMTSGVLNFSYDKNTFISKETLGNFTQELKRLVLEICDPNIPFNEKKT